MDFDSSSKPNPKNGKREGGLWFVAIIKIYATSAITRIWDQRKWQLWEEHGGLMDLPTHFNSSYSVTFFLNHHKYLQNKKNRKSGQCLNVIGRFHFPPLELLKRREKKKIKVRLTFHYHLAIVSIIYTDSFCFCMNSKPNKHNLILCNWF